MESDDSGSGALGCVTVIFIVLATLKITGTPPVASWSWIWIFGPFWIPAVITLGAALIIMAIIFLVRITERKHR